MGMAQTAREWTAQAVQELPDDGNRYEVVDGELLMTPAPAVPHQQVARELILDIGIYLREVRAGELLPAPSDVIMDPKTLVQPDVFVRRRDNTDILLLAIEVLSPSSARADRVIKRRRYQRAGIPEYWIVDIDARAIERWRPGDERPEILTDELVWSPEGATHPLTINLPELFDRARSG